MSKKYCKICGKETLRTTDIPFCAECISRANIRITPNNKGERIMKNYIKLGFGFYIGWTIAKVTHKIIGIHLGVRSEKQQKETDESKKD